MRIFRRRHDGTPFPWESMPGVKPILPLESDKEAKGSWRTLPSGEVVGLVRHRGSLGYSRSLHEVIHILLRDESHHPKTHFCARVTPQGWRLLPNKCSTPLQRRAARALMACPDGQFFEVVP